MNAPFPQLQLTRTIGDYADLAWSCLLPEQGDDLWEWCSKNLVLYGGQRWDPRRARLMRHWYRLINARLSLRPDPRDPYAHRCEQLWLCLGAQIAKSTLGFATVLGSVVNHPRIIGYYRNRLEDLKNDRDRKLLRMVEKTPALSRLLPYGAQARKLALGSRSWAIGNALINYRSAGIADDLRSDPIELAILEEFDTYTQDVEGYGDPIAQILDRMRTNAKTRLALGLTTPGVVAGHGWRRQCSGSAERPLVECPYCGGAQDLDGDRICLVGDRDLRQVHPSEIRSAGIARFQCLWCDEKWTATDLQLAITAMLEADSERLIWCAGEWKHDKDHPNGRWFPHADLTKDGRLKAIPPSESSVRSGQAGALYSTDETLDTLAAKRALALQGTVQQLKTYTNNDDAKPFIHLVTEADADDLSKNAQPDEPYQIGHLARAGRYKIVISQDQQGNTRGKFWFPYIVHAVEPGVASWLIDEGHAMNEAEADALEERTWMVGGKPQKADLVVRDSGNGNYRFDAYLWASAKSSLRILLRGDPRLPLGVPWQQVVDDPKSRRRTPKPSGVREYRVAPHYWRDVLWDRIRGLIRPMAPTPHQIATGTVPDTTADGLIEPTASATPLMRWYLPSDVSARYKRSLTSEEQVIEKLRIEGVWRDVVVWRPRAITTTADKQTFRDDNHQWDAEAQLGAALNIMGWDRPEVTLDDLGPITTPSGGGFMDGYSLT